MSHAMTLDRTASGEPLLNEQILAQYAKRKTSLLERLVVAYLTEAPMFHQSIRKGGADGDLDAVRLNAHALKSSSQNLGASRLSRLCQDIEHSAAGKDGAEVKRLLERLGPECFEAEEAIRGAAYRLTGKPVAMPNAPGVPAPASEPTDENY